MELVRGVSEEPGEQRGEHGHEDQQHDDDRPAHGHLVPAEPLPGDLPQGAVRGVGAAGGGDHFRVGTLRCFRSRRGHSTTPPLLARLWLRVCFAAGPLGCPRPGWTRPLARTQKYPSPRVSRYPHRRCPVDHFPAMHTATTANTSGANSTRRIIYARVRGILSNLSRCSGIVTRASQFRHVMLCNGAWCSAAPTRTFGRFGAAYGVGRHRRRTPPKQRNTPRCGGT